MSALGTAIRPASLESGFGHYLGVLGPFIAADNLVDSRRSTDMVRNTGRPYRGPTYTPDQFQDATEQWKDFSEEWTPWRERAAAVGIMFPPSGTKFDSWDDERPSQRAVLVRAIRETPDTLGWAIDKTPEPSWSAVVGRLFGAWNEMSSQIPPDPPPVGPSPQEASYSLKNIIDILNDS